MVSVCTPLLPSDFSSHLQQCSFSFFKKDSYLCIFSFSIFSICSSNWVTLPCITKFLQNVYVQLLSFTWSQLSSPFGSIIYFNGRLFTLNLWHLFHPLITKAGRIQFTIVSIKKNIRDLNAGLYHCLCSIDFKSRRNKRAGNLAFPSYSN